MRIGLDVGGTKIEAVALDPKGEEIYRERVDTPQGDYPQTLEAIAGLVERAEAKGKPKSPASVGLGIPGTISPRTGRVKNANSVWLNGQDLEKDLEARLGRPVRIANDANCLAVSEASDGAGKGAHLVFAIIVGTGCGAGIAWGGGPHSGQHGIAGEWGHNPLPWPTDADRALAEARPCYCGKLGCIELYLSGTGFAFDYRFRGGEAANGREVAAKLAQGEPLAQAVFADYVDRFARASAHVINLLDPDVLVLGGGMSRIDALYDAVPKKLEDWVFGRECEVPIRKALHGDSSGVRGAAWLWPQDPEA